ncbi:hypothetical protein ACSSS7_000474 [Eimeria intestinalis]
MVQGEAFSTRLGSEDSGTRLVPFWWLCQRTTEQAASDYPAFTWIREGILRMGGQGAKRFALLGGCFWLAFVCATEAWKARPRHCSPVGIEVPLTVVQFAARSVLCAAYLGRLRSPYQGTLSLENSKSSTELRWHPRERGLRGGPLSNSHPTALASLENSASGTQDDAPGGCTPECDVGANAEKQEDEPSTNRRNASSETKTGVLRPSSSPPEDWHSKRQRQKQRHAQYLRSGRRFGSAAPPAPLHPTEKKTISEKQTALEETVDRMLQDTNVQVVVNQLPNCRLSVEATISGEFTRQHSGEAVQTVTLGLGVSSTKQKVCAAERLFWSSLSFDLQLWELILTSLRASLRQSLHASALGVSEAVLLQRAGGPAAVRRDILRFTAEALTRKARLLYNARILGRLEFEEVGRMPRRDAHSPGFNHRDLNVLADRLSPGSPLNVRLCGEAYPKINFKRPYKGLKLKVRKQPYAKGALFRATEDYLLFKHSKTVNYPDPQPLASEGDTLLLRVDQGWFEEPDGTMGPEIPSEYIKGQTTLHLVRPWLPDELLESVEGVAAGERRTIRVPIPFQTRQLLNICERQTQNLPNSSGHLESTSCLRETKSGSPGSSLVPAYLSSLANNTKKNVFAKLFGDSNEQRSLVDAEKEEELHSEFPREEEGASAREKEEWNESDEEQAHHVDCFLEVECLAVKRRVPPEPTDDFFVQISGMTRAQLWDEIEASAESLVTQAASKYALGAAAAALDEITQADIPESLVDLQAKATWSQQLKVRKLQGEDNSRIGGPEAFLKWKEENKRSVENILKTAYAIQAVCKKEGLEVNEQEVQAELGTAMLQAPTESMEALAKQLYKKAQARLVYEFIVKHADIEFFVDETPAEVSVETDGERKAQQGVKAFPKGTNLEEWQRKCQQMKRERDSLRDTARRFFVDAKTLRKYDKKNGL